MLMLQRQVGSRLCKKAFYSDRNNQFLAGLDYDGASAAQLTYSPSISSALFNVNIISNDDLTELREFFEAIITGFFVRRTVDGPQLTLSDQERDRIMIITPSARVYIIVRSPDSNL